MSYTNNWVNGIRKTLIESHTKEEIEALSTSELKKLHKEYLAKGTVEAKEEAAEIKKEIESRGEEKSDVAQQNEELLAILDVLCEMVGVDVETLIEQMTRKDWQNLGHAHEWDKPAPAAAPHGKLAANARDVMVMAARARGTRSERQAAAARADAIPAGEETAHKLEMSGKDRLHEPTAARRARGAPSVEFNTRAFDSIQDFIERSADETTRRRMQNDAFNAMKPFALQPKPKGKGKGKK